MGLGDAVFEMMFEYNGHIHVYEISSYKIYENIYTIICTINKIPNATGNIFDISQN